MLLLAQCLLTSKRISLNPITIDGSSCDGSSCVVVSASGGGTVIIFRCCCLDNL